ncbi:MAG: hypothetical protein QF902_02220 [Rhodospirillales bacterium]|nr:hypothetical protein [Rhodospirillales bacterium]
MSPPATKRATIKPKETIRPLGDFNMTDFKKMKCSFTIPFGDAR